MNGTPAGGAGSVGAVRWLTPDEREAWLGLTRLMLTLPAALDAQLQRDAGLSYFEYMVLAMLSEQPDRTLRMSRLAEATSSSLSRLSNVVTRLERRGLLDRRPDPQDRRATLAVLSDAGWRLLVRTAPGHVTTVRELVIDSLTGSRLAGLREACQAILDRLDPAAVTHPDRWHHAP